MEENEIHFLKVLIAIAATVILIGILTLMKCGQL